MHRPTNASEWLDLAVKAALAALALALVFFVYTYVSGRMADANSSPAARAVENLEQAVRADPNNITARLRYADALAAAGRAREAAEQYQLVMEISPDDPGALAGLAQIAMNQAEWRTAEGYWRRIVGVLQSSEYATVDQRLEKAYFYLGSTLMEVQEYEEAATYLSEALRLRNDASDTYFLLAIAYREMDSPSKYRENLERALQFDPLLAEANYEYGLILLGEGDTGSAAEYFRVSVDNAPPERTEPIAALNELGSAPERLAAAQAAVTAGDYEQALEEARIASALDPGDIESVRIVARMYAKAGTIDAERAVWERVLSLAPQDPEAVAAIEKIGDTAE